MRESLLMQVVNENKSSLISERSAWIAEQVVGDQILTLGDQQADLPILLGRKEIKVTGLLPGYDSFSQLTRLLEKEKPQVKNCVDLFQQHFLEKQRHGKTFQTIIFSGKLEAAGNLKNYFEEAMRILEPNGRIILDVPYGKTLGKNGEFYLSDLLELEKAGMCISSLKFFQTSIGITFKKTGNRLSGIILDKQLTFELEQLFKRKENHYLDEIDAWRSKLSEQKEATIKLIENQIERSKTEIEVLYDYHEKFLEHENLVRELTVLKRKYQALSSSKLGKVTLYFWGLRKKYRR